MVKICKECLVEKDLVEFYKHPEGTLGTLPRCKQCILKGRKTERERILSRARDQERYKNNPKRREYIFNRGKQYNKNNPLKLSAHRIVNNFLRNKKKWKINYCQNCSKSGRIELHHEDYECPNLVINLCNICHSALHHGELSKDLLNEINIFKL